MDTEIVRKWEYMIVALDVSEAKQKEGLARHELDRTCAQLGDAGWEMVTAVPMNTYMGTASVTLFFKRPKQ